MAYFTDFGLLLAPYDPKLRAIVLCPYIDCGCRMCRNGPRGLYQSERLCFNQPPRPPDTTKRRNPAALHTCTNYKYCSMPRTQQGLSHQ